MDKEDVPKLTTGSRYRVLSMMTRDEPLETVGNFVGYTMIGNIDALCLDTAKEGKGRSSSSKKAKGSKEGRSLVLIPAQMVISVEILDQVKEKKTEDPSSSSRYYA